jgi:hypothetical protein
MEPADLQNIVTAYGAALAEPTAMGLPRDARSLPYTKTDIKVALLIALRATTDPAMRNSLEAAFVSLADFQELSDDEVRALQLWDQALSSRADESVIEKVTAQAELVTAVRRRIADEARALGEELKAARV